MAEAHGRFGSRRRSADCGFFSLLTILLVAACLALGGCGGSSGGGNPPIDEPPDNNAPPDNTTPPAPLVGSRAALVTSVIKDVYDVDNVDPDEYSEDVFGRSIQRTGIKIIFHNDATVGDVNDLLIEFSADIVATLAGYPAVVVRIPDTGTLQALDTLIADLESRRPVHSVLKSIQLELNTLPPNLERAIFGQSNPEIAAEWEHIDHHLAVRGAAGWSLSNLIAERPTVVLADKFGAGDPDPAIFDVVPIPEEANFGIVPGTPNAHGYQMLSIIASRHSESSQSAPGDYTTGMAPSGVQLGVIDFQSQNPQAVAKRFMTLIRDSARVSRGPVVVNLSLGLPCTGRAATDPCNRKVDLEKDVLDFINMVRHIDVESRVLFVAAAGNVSEFGSPTTEPTDAQTQSVWNAATLLDDWVDPFTQVPVESLKNVLVVENAMQDNSMPFGVRCIHESSFVGGHLAGIGQHVYMMSAETGTARSVKDAGTSAATAQVSGVAAYLAALRPDLTAQELMRLLIRTAEPLSGSGTECTPLNSEVPVVDAYATLLATDESGVIDARISRARLELLDVTGSTAGSAPDGAFNIDDLKLWISELTDSQFPDGKINYGRYDLNGDGTTGGPNTDRFDLDISMDLNSETSVPFFVVDYDLLGTPISYSEDLLTDVEIVCYYANSDLYEIGLNDPFTADARDAELRKIKAFCDPCLAAAQVSAASKEGLATLQAEEAPICEGVVVTIDPSSASVQTGGTAQFSAIVTGAGDTSVTWSASGGSITTAGLYLAGNTPGDFTVTATSVEDASITATAQVQIGEGGTLVDPRFTGAWIGTEVTLATAGFTKQCGLDPVENKEDCIEFRFLNCGITGECLLARQESCQINQPSSVSCSEQVVNLYNGTFSENTYTGQLIGSVVNASSFFEKPPGCEIKLTLDEKTTGDAADDTLTGIMPGGRLSDDCSSPSIESSSYTFRRR